MQRVGLAQALINDPEVMFLDEPMSGLDPLGRREVRDLILGLRDARLHGVLQLAHPVGRGGAVQPGRRSWRRAGSLAAGRLDELLAFELQGLGASCGGRPSDDSAALPARVRSVTPLSHGRVALELAPDAEPDRVMCGASRRRRPRRYR